jgi:CBS domain containing-hemolysin-like protein
MRALIEIPLIVFLLFVAAITAGSEISIIAVSRIKLRKLASEGSRTARLIIKILETPERFFSTILVTNNIVNSLIAVIIAAILLRLVGERGGWGVVAATLVSAFLIIVCEVTAKTVAARHSERMSFMLARPISWLIKASVPVIWALERVVNAMTALVGGGSGGKSSLVTEEEIRALIKISEEEGILHKEKYRMLSKVFDFGEAVVRSVMTPKRDVTAVDADGDLDATIESVIESGYSRLPVYRGTGENIIGMINMKDLLHLSRNRDLIVLQDIIYPATFVPESKKVTELLKEFQKGHTHLAIVNDAQGKVCGIVTLEDLIEEIVGEIEDEFDVRAAKTGAGPAK